MKLYFDDTDFDGQLQRSVAKVVEGCADAGEVIAGGRTTGSTA